MTEEIKVCIENSQKPELKEIQKYVSDKLDEINSTTLVRPNMFQECTSIVIFQSVIDEALLNGEIETIDAYYGYENLVSKKQVNIYGWNSQINKYKFTHIYFRDELKKQYSVLNPTCETMQPETNAELKYLINTLSPEKWKLIDTSKVTDMRCLFYGFDKELGDISGWDVSHVKDMSYMFSYSNFTGDISKWDVSSVEYMEGMFECTKFTGDISKWNVENVKNMSYMFAYSKFNGDISDWNMKNIEKISYMFAESSFTGDISKWEFPKYSIDQLINDLTSTF